MLKFAEVHACSLSNRLRTRATSSTHIPRAVRTKRAGRSGRRRCNKAARAEYLPQNDDIIVTGVRCNATCQANLREQERIKWVLFSNRFVLNPYYDDPAPWSNLENILKLEVGAFAAAGAVAAAPAAGTALFSRGTGLLNSNNVLRLGWSWKGSHSAGRLVFRMSVGHRSWQQIPRLPTFPWHIP